MTIGMQRDMPLSELLTLTQKQKQNSNRTSFDLADISRHKQFLKSTLVENDKKQGFTNVSAEVGRFKFGNVQGSISLEEWQQQRADALNATKGGLDGCDCPICLNKGVTYTVKDNDVVSVECECMNKRRSIWSMRYSGLGDLLQYDFDNFLITADWQRTFADAARAYLKQANNGEWLYCGGQNGGGKTHICTAVCKGLMNNGFKVRYLLWRDILQKLRALKFKEEEFNAFVSEIKSIEVLYIDDFFKGKRGKKIGDVDDDEVKYAYDVINWRYQARDKRKRTIISSEYLLNELIDIDSATAGRIREKCGKYKLQIQRSPDRDYRFQRK